MNNSIFAGLMGRPRATPKAEETEDEAEKDEEETGAEENEDEEESAEEKDEKTDADEDDEGEEKDEDEAGAKDRRHPKAESPTKQAFALLRSPEAKGRQKLAAELAEDVAEGRMTGKRARALLAAAPKASRLGEAMAGKDVNPGSDAGSKGASSQDDRLVAFAKETRERRRKRA